MDILTGALAVIGILAIVALVVGSFFVLLIIGESMKH